jgi:type II secretion system protein J
MNRSSFTLLEVLLVIVIFSLLATTVYGIFVKSATDIRTCETLKTADRLGAAAVTLICRDLRGILPRFGDSPALEGTVSGESASSVEMATSSDSRTLTDGKPSDVTTVGYITSPNEQETGLNKLYRREIYGASEGSTGNATYKMIDDRVKSFTLEYYDGSAWQSVWSDATLPRAVKVNLTISRNIPNPQTGGAIEKTFTYSGVAVLPAAK